MRYVEVLLSSSHRISECRRSSSHSYTSVRRQFILSDIYDAIEDRFVTFWMTIFYKKVDFQYERAYESRNKKMQNARSLW